MTLSIKNWDSVYEKADTRKCKDMKWIAVPTKMDGLRFKKIAAHKDKYKVFSCWILLLQIASKMPERGVLKSELGDLTFEDMELMTGFPADGFKLILPFLVQIQWITDSSGDHPDSIPKKQEIILTTRQDNTGHNKTIQTKSKNFQKPTIEEVYNYCVQRKNTINAETFVAHYEANGWKVGSNKMKNWKAAVVTWEARNNKFSNNTSRGIEPPKSESIADVLEQQRNR